MPWVIEDLVTQRAEFVSLVNTEAFSFKEVCRRFNISRSTGYKWLGRFSSVRSIESLKDYSRRPLHSPTKTDLSIEEAIVGLRREYPYWGARKLSILFQEKYPTLKVPKERTLNRILKRNDLLTARSPKGEAFKRFEYEKPNDLWQMDYKGQFRMSAGMYCYPLTVLDDHSRFNLVLDAHGEIKGTEVKRSLVNAFREYGMPQKMLMDRGTPWYAVNDRRFHYTKLTLWLSKLGIEITHSGAYHPQTLGKDERFHRTLKYDLIERCQIYSIYQAQEVFSSFRHEYNYLRPHDALGLRRPAEVYRPSSTRYSEKMQTFEYPKDYKVKKVYSKGQITYEGKEWHIHQAMAGEYVGIKSLHDKSYEVYFGKTLVRTIEV
jgi:transposase InsO family protein